MPSNCGAGEDSYGVEKTLNKEIKPVNPKGNQPWIFIGKRCWSSKILATWCEEPTHWKRPWFWERLRGRSEGSDRGWDGWMASLTQWTWVWANSGRQWSIGKPCVLQSVRSQRVGHDLATEQQQELIDMVIQQKPTQRCKVSIFQLKMKKI